MAVIAALCLAPAARAAGPGGGNAADSARTPHKIAADSSLEAVLTAVKASYEAAHPTQDLQFTFGPSGSLRDQIMRRAIEPEVFISAGESEMAALLIGGRVAGGSSVPLATNRLLLVTGARGRLSTLTGLKEERVRKIAIGNPGTVPLGRESVGALKGARVWTEVKPKLRYCASSGEVVAVVERNEVDAAVAYATDALDNPKLRIVAGLDAYGGVTRYVAAPVLNRQGAAGNDDFIRYLKEPAARVIWQHWHFGEP